MTKTTATADTKEFVTKHIANSEKLVDSIIEYNAACFKGGEVIAKKMYENYVANVASVFDGVKALNKTNDIAEFSKVATSNVAAATERFAEQSKSMVELSSKVMKDTGEAGRLAYAKGFSVEA